MTSHTEKSPKRRWSAKRIVLVCVVALAALILVLPSRTIELRERSAKVYPYESISNSGPYTSAYGSGVTSKVKVVYRVGGRVVEQEWQRAIVNMEEGGDKTVSIVTNNTTSSLRSVGGIDYGSHSEQETIAVTIRGIDKN